MKRGLYKTQAVVLNSFDYGESDRIIIFSTGDYGKIKGIAKGARRSRKRFVGRLEPASLIDLIFHYNEKTELVRVEEASLVEGFPNLRIDIESFSTACYLVELTDVMTRPGQCIPGVFKLLVDFLKMLDNGAPAGPMHRFFEIKFLSIAGYMPSLHGCVLCGESMGGGGDAGAAGADAGGRVLFSPEKGGLLCSGCAAGREGLIPVTTGTARFLETAERLEPEKLSRLRPGPAFVAEAESLLDGFIRFHIGRELKTKKFLSGLRNFSC